MSNNFSRKSVVSDWAKLMIRFLFTSRVLLVMGTGKSGSHEVCKIEQRSRDEKYLIVRICFANNNLSLNERS